MRTTKNENITRARKASFAIAKKLFVNDAHFWAFVQKSFNVQSRTELTERDWVKIEARLRAAEMFSSCRDALFYEVNQ